MKCDKIAINKLEKSDINGNYLFSDNKNYYFDTKMRNSIFLKDKEEPSLVVSFDCYYKYFNELITVCKNSQNKPSILYVGNDYNNEIFNEIDDEKTNFNDEQMFAKLTKTEKFDKLFEYLVQSRTQEDIFVMHTPLFIFVDDFSKINKSNLVRFATVSRSRQIYFVLLIKDENEFDALDFEFIDSNCPLKFFYSANGNFKIWDYYNGTLDKDKKSFIGDK